MPINRIRELNAQREWSKLARTMADAWRNFDAKILKPARILPGSVQYIEMKRAFYAGGSTVMDITILIGETDEIGEADGAQLLEHLNDEFVQFADDMKKGIA